MNYIPVIDNFDSGCINLFLVVMEDPSGACFQQRFCTGNWSPQGYWRERESYPYKHREIAFPVNYMILTTPRRSR